MSKRYAYVSRGAAHLSAEMTLAIQTEKVKAFAKSKTIDFVFSEENSSGHGRIAFKLLLQSNLNKGDEIVIYSYHCLVDWEKDFLHDIYTHLHEMRSKGCIVTFLKENISTSTPQSRLALSNLIAADQYRIDVTNDAEKAKAEKECSATGC